MFFGLKHKNENQPDLLSDERGQEELNMLALNPKSKFPDEQRSSLFVRVYVKGGDRKKDGFVAE